MTIVRNLLDRVPLIYFRRWRKMVLRASALLRYPLLPLRAKPTFIVFGTHKCGTTSLYAELAGHRQVAPALRKEIHFFESPRMKKLGFGFYLAHFPLRRQLQDGGGAPRVTGEATPGYIYSRRAAQTIARRLPDCRLIAVIRDPTDRAISHYHHQARFDRESRSIEEALGQSLEEQSSHECPGPDDETWIDPKQYVGRGLYARYLEYWYEVFPADQILVVGLDDLVSDTMATVTVVCAFIGIDPPEHSSEFSKRNVGGARTTGAELIGRLDEFYREPNRDLAELLRRKQPERPLPRWLAEPTSGD